MTAQILVDAETIGQPAGKHCLDQAFPVKAFSATQSICENR
jgi:hypothetical protein